MDCLRLFATAPEDHSRATTIDIAAPNCQCESQQVSPHCPNPIQLNEILIRLVMDPTHTETEANGTRVTTALFSDAASFGSSCLRELSAKPEEYHRTVAAIIEDRPKANDGTLKSVFGVVIVPVNELKKIYHEIEIANKQTEKFVAFGAYATALEDRPSHADIMVNRVSNISKSKANRATINLAKALRQNFLSITAFADRVDLEHWSKNEVEKRYRKETGQE